MHLKSAVECITTIHLFLRAVVFSPVVPHDGVQLFLFVSPGELVQPLAEDAHHGGGEHQQRAEHAADDEERPAVREGPRHRRRN